MSEEGRGDDLAGKGVEGAYKSLTVTIRLSLEVGALVVPLKLTL